MPETVDLFFYGTLRDPDVRRAVLGPAATGLKATAAAIPRYRCAPVAGGRYPVLVPEEGSSASGLLMSSVPLDAAARASLFEDDGNDYLASPVTVYPEEGGAEAAAGCTAWAFLAGAGLAPEPGEWSIEVWERRHRAAFLTSSLEAMRRVDSALLARHRAAWLARLRGA